ncbi:MAG: sigma-54-dependent Fis family transcriptional regulator [Planctomycetes bacterium]|nr:sigma-54-dependent Fis family transcriptional regulator [Planctomycetota bacterium]
MLRILLVDDESAFRESFAQILRDAGFACTAAPDAEAGLAALAAAGFDLLLTDLELPGMGGVQFLERARELAPETLTAVITGHGTFGAAVDALRMGAAEILAKPVFPEEALRRIRALLDRRDRLRELVGLRREVRRAYAFENLIGRSAGMREVYALITKLAAAATTVLITGESGTGKELVARALHHLGRAPDLPFLAINCAAIPEPLLESELFGHTRGAFTGADAEKPGLFEVAGRGSIFLDEIADLSPALQAKVLRAVEEKEILRVGAVRPVRVNARVLAATNRDLGRMVAAGGFRSDLFFRINVVELRLPALRERMEDIPALAEHFIAKHAAEIKRKVRGLEDAAMRALLAYPWPGNVRELENVIERGVILADGALIRLVDLPPALSLAAAGAPGEDLRAAVRAFERHYIAQVLRGVGGDKEAAARRLGIGLSSLYRKLGQCAPPDDGAALPAGDEPQTAGPAGDAATRAEEGG